MSEIFSPTFAPAARTEPVASEGTGTRVVLIGIAIAFLALFLVLPLIAVFTQALSKGLDAFLAAFREPDAGSAIRLTLTVAAIAVPFNVVFGLAASWAIAKFEFTGKSLLIT